MINFLKKHDVQIAYGALAVIDFLFYLIAIGAGAMLGAEIGFTVWGMML